MLFNESQTQKVNFQLNEVCFQDKKVCLYDGMTNQLASRQDQQKVSFLFESYLLVVSEVYSTHKLRNYPQVMHEKFIKYGLMVKIMWTILL